MSTNDKSVQRDTFIRFKDGIEMEECFREFGIELKCDETETNYYDSDGESIGKWGASLLRKHGIEARVETRTYKTISNDAKKTIKAQFDLDCVLDIYEYSIQVRTHDLTARQHKAMVKRILWPIRLKGYKVKYDCTQSVATSVCAT